MSLRVLSSKQKNIKNLGGKILLGKRWENVGKINFKNWLTNPPSIWYNISVGEQLKRRWLTTLGVSYIVVLLLTSCYTVPVGTIIPEKPVKNVYEGYDGLEIKNNQASLSNKEFKLEVEEWASKQKYADYWIRYFEAQRIGRKYIDFAVIYYVLYNEGKE